MKTPALLFCSAFALMAAGGSALAGPVFHHTGTSVGIQIGAYPRYGAFYPGFNHSYYRPYYRPYYRDAYYYPGIALAAALTIPAIIYASQNYPVSYSNQSWVSIPSSSYSTSYSPEYSSSYYSSANYGSYDSPGYTVSSAPDSYGAAQPALSGASSNQDWLYCDHPDGFYPAIRDCPSGWRRVADQGR